MEEIPDFLKEEKNEISRNIRFAINLASKPQFKTIILTDDKNLSKYNTNKHFESILSVNVVSTDKAKSFIQKFFRETKQARENKRDLRC